MVDKTSYMFITGPDVIKTVTHEDVTKEELGGAVTHNETPAWRTSWPTMTPSACAWSASCSLSFRPTISTIRRASRLHRSHRTAPTLNSTPWFPTESNQPYDIKEVITRVVDDGYFFEVQEHYAKNIVVGFARLDGRSVGIVANQPAFLAGVLDIDASVKGARFVRFCDCLQYSR